jgi:hypothetical protein
MRFLIDIIIILLICFSTLLFIAVLFSTPECQINHINCKKNAEKRCQLLLAIRLQQVAPIQFAAHPKFVDDPTLQNGLLGYTIKDLVAQYEAGKSPTIRDFDILGARQRLKNLYNYTVY